MGCDMTLGTFFQNRNLFTGLTFQNDIRQYQFIRITGNWINHPHTLPAFSAVQSNLLHHNTLLSYKNSDSVLVKEKGICHLCKLLRIVDQSIFDASKFRRTCQCRFYFVCFRRSKNVVFDNFFHLYQHIYRCNNHHNVLLSI